MARILVLTSRWPFPAYGGDKNRILEICRQLACEHELILIAASEMRPNELLPDPAIFRHVEKIPIPRWRSYLNCLLALPGSKPLQLAYYRSRRYRQAVERYSRNADVILAHLIRTAQYVPKEFKGITLLEITDAVSLVLKRGRAPGRLGKFLSRIYAIEAQRVERYEKECLNRFDHVSLVSAVDRDHLLKTHGSFSARLVLATLGVSDSRFICAHRPTGTAVVFLGNMQTLPNIDACDFFLQDCLPLIRRVHPQIHLRIIGPIPTKVAQQFARYEQLVQIVGEVPELCSAIEGAFCAVAPMRRGAGIQTKILDYLALGLPAVVSQIGNEGLSAQHGKDLLIASTAEEIAAAVISLFEDNRLGIDLASAGRRYVRRHHRWANCVQPIAAAIGSKAT